MPPSLEPLKSSQVAPEEISFVALPGESVRNRIRLATREGERLLWVYSGPLPDRLLTQSPDGPILSPLIAQLKAQASQMLASRRPWDEGRAQTGAVTTFDF